MVLRTWRPSRKRKMTRFPMILSYTLLQAVLFALSSPLYFSSSLLILGADAQQISLTLPVLDGADTGGAPIVGYDMQIDDGKSGAFRYVLGGNRSENTLATSVFLTAESDGVEKGLTYRVRYRAINEIGEGPWSDISYVRAATLPAAPASPAVTFFDDTRIDLALATTSDNGGSAGGAVFRYRLHVDEGTEGSVFHELTGYDGVASSYSVAAGAAHPSGGAAVFAAGTTYTFKLTAENEVGSSELRYLAPTLRVALGSLPATPNTPTIVESGSSDTQLSLAWAAADQTETLPVLRFILWGDLGVPGNSHVIYNSTALSQLAFVHSGLVPGTLYAYWLQVENFNGPSADLSTSPAAWVRRHACSPPSHFVSLSVPSRGRTAVALEWQEPGASPGCPISGYAVLADDGLGAALTAVSLPGGAAQLPGTQFEFSVDSPADLTLVPGRSYRFAVVAYNAVGSQRSNVELVVAADVPAQPTAGPAMVLSETTAGQIRVALSPFAESDDDATGGSPIVSYHLQRTPALGPGQAEQITDTFFDVGGGEQQPSLATAYTVAGLGQGQAFGFRYRAANVNGAGAWSAVTYITAATVPAPPTASPAYLSSTDSEIVVQLATSLDDGGSPITDYELEMDGGVPTD